MDLSSFIPPHVQLEGDWGNAMSSDEYFKWMEELKDRWLDWEIGSSQLGQREA